MWTEFTSNFLKAFLFFDIFLVVLKCITVMFDILLTIIVFSFFFFLFEDFKDF